MLEYRFKLMTAQETLVEVDCAPAMVCVSASSFGGVGFVPLVPVLIVAIWAYSCGRRRHACGPDQPGADAAPQDTASFYFGNSLFCPICCAEYLPETEACDDCGVHLVEEDDVPVADVRIEEGVVRIARTWNVTEAHLLRNFLAANRIPSSILRCIACDTLGADLFVLESDVLRAKRLLTAHMGTAVA